VGEAPIRLDGRCAVVTGGGTGIGEAVARLLATQGADVVVASRKVENLERVASEVGAETGRTVLPVRCDVRDEASCTELVERAAEAMGRIDILVNNAGGSYMFPFLETPVDRYDNNMALNLRGPYVLIQAVAPHMIRQGGGAIVNISSAAGVDGVRGGAVYSASKAGLQMLTRVVASELGPYNIRCNCIAVGAVASEGALRSWARFGMTPESVGARAPLRRAGRPEDIANGVLYFVSDLSSWVSGETLGINGGPVLGGLPDEPAPGRQDEPAPGRQ
jgi:NAD(P)-dependent dehydrogenase (short-subunit alcohol dehydrogenase family)